MLLLEFRLRGCGERVIPCLPEGDRLGPGLEGGGLGDGALELVPVYGAVVVRINLLPHTRTNQRKDEHPLREKIGPSRDWRLGVVQ